MPTVLDVPPDAARAVQMVERGLPWANAEALAAVLEVSLATIATLLDIPTATFYRRKKARRFSKQESDRLMRFVRLWLLASRVFGNEEGARSWLKDPQFGLRGAIPLQYARTEAGASEVDNLLHRIDYNILA